MQIQRLKLKSKKLEAQKAFYVHQLGFELLESTDNSFTIKAGVTELIFEKSDVALCYHFAFNIPSFQIKEGLSWLQEKKVDFIKYKDAYLVDFKSWNADAVYFYDADLNIVELIARKNMEIKSEKIFSIDSILNVSEIGMPVSNVEATFNRLSKDFKLKQYSGDQHYFCAMGDEEGLFIIVDQHSKRWMPTDLPALSVPFQLTMLQEGEVFEFESFSTQR